MRKLVTIVLSALTIGVPLAACGSSTTGSQTASYYAPAWSSEPPGVCYYVYTPAEVPALIAGGACAPRSVPVQAPVAWQETYWNYYDSTAYYDVYIPAGYRTRYISTESMFGTRYHRAILTRSRTATYKSSTGTIVHGYQSGKVTFGSGTSFGTGGTKYGGGNLRNRNTPLPAMTKPAQPNGSNLRHSTYRSSHGSR
jgi:hypothetical protein